MNLRKNIREEYGASIKKKDTAKDIERHWKRTRDHGIQEKRIFLEGGVININKCKHKVKMTQTQMCLLYSATYGIRSGLIKMDRTEVKFKSLGINGK